VARAGGTPGLPGARGLGMGEGAQERVLPGRAAAADRRDHARPALGRDHARLHARLPLARPA
jgi:hypothetical protein